jgi:lyso-ornithine lipid O-acyltransferase
VIVLLSLILEWSRVVIKALLCIGVIVLDIAFGLLAVLLLRPDWTRRARSLSCHYLSRVAAYVLGIRVQGQAPRLPTDRSQPVLMIANHVGYVDIVLFLSQIPCVFITSRELGANPILGPVARMGGSYLVDRQNKFSLKNEIRDIARLLRAGFPVFLFPEATSSDGSGILPFKRALLEAGIQSEATIYPFCINYLRLDGVPLNEQNRNRLFYYGDAEFASHLIGLLKIRRIDVEVLSLAPVRVTRDTDSRSLCEQLEEEVKAGHKPVRL